MPISISAFRAQEQNPKAPRTKRNEGGEGRKKGGRERDTEDSRGKTASQERTRRRRLHLPRLALLPLVLFPHLPPGLLRLPGTKPTKDKSTACPDKSPRNAAPRRRVHRSAICVRAVRVRRGSHAVRVALRARRERGRRGLPLINASASRHDRDRERDKEEGATRGEEVGGRKDVKNGDRRMGMKRWGRGMKTMYAEGEGGAGGGYGKRGAMEIRKESLRGGGGVKTGGMRTSDVQGPARPGSPGLGSAS
ncbi:hypothetical protein FB451DRAFT_1179091 [Mycena latifolia]|nr:hypothetical protein FB451DRAFT_1179091 [Mycena latifolia]